MDGLCPSCISLIETQDETNAFYAPREIERGRAGYKDQHNSRETHRWNSANGGEPDRKTVCARASYAYTILYYYTYIYLNNTLKRQTARILPPSF